MNILTFCNLLINSKGLTLPSSGWQLGGGLKTFGSLKLVLVSSVSAAASSIAGGSEIIAYQFKFTSMSDMDLEYL